MTVTDRLRTEEIDPCPSPQTPLREDGLGRRGVGKKWLAKLLGSLALGILILYCVLGRFDLHQTEAAMRQARVPAFALGLALMVTAYLLRGMRWRIWEHSLSYLNSLRLILIGFMGNNVLPMRLGELLRAHCSAPKTSEDRGRTTALASISAERVLDGLILSALGLGSLVLVPVDRRLHSGLLLVSLAFGGLTSGLVLCIRLHKRIRHLIADVNRRFPGHLTAYAREKACQFLDGLLPLGTLPRMLSSILATALIWGVEAASYYFIGMAVWSGMSAAQAMLFLVAVNFASLVPLTIGGIGTIEAVAPVFLISSGVPPPMALAMVLLQHSGQYLFTTVSGGAVYLAGDFHKIPFAHPKRVLQRAAARAEHGPVIQKARRDLRELGESVELRPAPGREIDLSIVIPAFNEQARLPRTILETLRWCTARKLTFELIIVDDGSLDETLALARLFEQSDVRVRSLACPHVGKGSAVRMGMLNAKGGAVLFMDADGATRLDEIAKLLAAIDQGYDIAIGSRVVQRPGEAEVKASLHRRFIGRSFAFLVNVMALQGIGDTQCGFKMFRRGAAQAIFSRQRLTGFAFDVEILFIAQRLSLSFIEIPVNWVAQPGSKVNLVADSIKMLWDIAHIRWMHRTMGSSPAPVSARGSLRLGQASAPDKAL